jgi:hypothetical protein
MYGTIARYRVKPGMLDDFQAWQEANPVEDRRPGAMLVYQMDRDPNELFLVIAAENRAAFRATSESPEMHDRFLRMMEFLAAEPEWNDGEIIASEFDL